MWLFICVLGICLLNRTAKRFLSSPASCLVSWIRAAQDKLSCKCLTAEVTDMPLIKDTFYIVAGGKGGFLGNTLEEEHVVRESVSF